MNARHEDLQEGFDTLSGTEKAALLEIVQLMAKDPRTVLDQIDHLLAAGRARSIADVLANIKSRH